MKTTLSAILLSLSLFATGGFAAPPPAHDTQPGSGPGGAHSPTGTFGLVYNGSAYKSLCYKAPHWFSRDKRPRACFDTQIHLQNYLSAPNPQTLSGYIDTAGTNFVLFEGQIITLAETYEIHVNAAKHHKDRKRGCAEVKIYHLPEWHLQIKETWCPGKNKPVEL